MVLTAGNFSGSESMGPKLRKQTTLQKTEAWSNLYTPERPPAVSVCIIYELQRTGTMQQLQTSIWLLTKKGAGAFIQFVASKFKEAFKLIIDDWFNIQDHRFSRMLGFRNCQRFANKMAWWKRNPSVATLLSINNIFHFNKHQKARYVVLRCCVCMITFHSPQRWQHRSGRRSGFTSTAPNALPEVALWQSNWILASRPESSHHCQSPMSPGNMSETKLKLTNISNTGGHLPPFYKLWKLHLVKCYIWYNQKLRTEWWW